MTAVLLGSRIAVMELIPFVKHAHAQQARSIEERFLDIGRSAGILFVSVEVSPTLHPQEEPIYRILLGCSRRVRSSSIKSMARMVMANYYEKGLQLHLEVRHGEEPFDKQEKEV